MGRMTRITKFFRGTEGSVAVIIALGIVALLGAASLAIDMGHLYTVRNELQNSADAAALAAASNLIKDNGTGTAVRDPDAAKQAALLVAQRQSQLSGLPNVSDADRNDLAITFGVWNINAASPDVAWTEIGPTCGIYSNANAVKITIIRGADTVFGPVTNFCAGIFGHNTSQIAATATAYLGYTTETLPGTVQVPLTLPNTVLTAAKGQTGWFARLFGPAEAVASARTYKFRDTGGGYVNTSVTSANPLDPAQAYLFTVGQNDSVPGTIWDILNRVYDPTHTSSNPVVVGDLKLGQQIYARSEFMYGNAYIGPIFQRLQKAYYYKTTGNANTAPPAGTPWRVTLPVYGTTPHPLAFRHRYPGSLFLARLLAFLGPSEAYACYTMPPPKTYVNGFANADITGVTYNASGNEGSYTYPKTISTPPPLSGSTTYTDKKDFLERNSGSVWNVNTVTIENVTDADTAPPSTGGSLSGGQSNQNITPGGANKGAFASIPRLVK
jgi:Flp pilus assembly protein TadG